MSFFYYPYFWGRKEPHWKEKILFDDADPEFADFIRAGAARVTRKYEVRQGWQNVEAQLREGAGEGFAVGDNAFARLLKPCIVPDGGGRTGHGEAIEGVGVEAVLHPFERLDQRPLANGKANS